ncbi:MAG: hypothetical protein JO122_15410 [Acetobacteraceae bacterium]|nr:hypothetical protein [Chloroflexota bacterium]MBV8457993.1 hypothetical protein [Acetobacteraceae bacterium]
MFSDHLVIPALILSFIAAVASSGPESRQAARELVQAISATVTYGEQQADGDSPVIDTDDSSYLR